MSRLLVVLAALAMTLAACGGESKEEKASKQVCDARADIAKQVNTLQGMTVSTATVSAIQSSVTAIANDLKQIQSAQSDLSGQRKNEVQEANKAFSSQIKSIVSSLGSTTSLSEAKSQLTTALQQLASSYQQTFAKVDCSS